MMLEHNKVFKGKEIRIKMIEGEPWFCNVDVCKLLDLGNPRQAIAKFPLTDKRVIEADTFTGKKGLSWISEPGLYNLIFKSVKEEAKEFQKWVTGDLLPTLRKTGGYSLKDKSDPEEDEVIATLKQMILVNQQMIKNRLKIKENEGKIKTLKKEQSELKHAQEENEIRFSEIDAQRREAMEALIEAERSEEDPPELSLRKKITVLVKNYAIATNIPHAQVWTQIYKGLLNTYSYSVWKRTKNTNKKRLEQGKKKITFIEQVELSGKLEELFIVASKELCLDEELKEKIIDIGLGEEDNPKTYEKDGSNN